VASLSLSKPPLTGSGPRPVNLKTDLAPLADLIEIAFADTMDSGGRAAIREMRALSKLGPGLGFMPGMHDLMIGVGMGFVWIEDGRLVGNVSIYPASLPPEARRAWIIANVAVHPDYRERGIARSLMLDSLSSVRQRSDRSADVILQVEAPNWKARALYETLGFSDEGAFTLWRRGPSRVTDSLPLSRGPYITRRSWNEWKSELALAYRARPAERGGIGWLRPPGPSLFRPSLRKWANDLVNLRGKERLIVQDEDGALRAALWIERGFGAGAVQLTLIAEPDATDGADMALLLSALRRFGPDHTLAIEHPADDEAVCAMLERFGFRKVRTLVHMRWRP
jgi:ribosomal protein S18 acetylase RimI-like enzyme